MKVKVVISLLDKHKRYMTPSKWKQMDIGKVIIPVDELFLACKDNFLLIKEKKQLKKA